MGLASLLLGDKNPLSQFVAENRNAIRGFSAGFGQGTNLNEGLSAGAVGANLNAPLDDIAAQQRKAAEEQAKQKNQTVEYLRQKFPDLGAALDSGAPMNEVWNEALNRMKPQAPGDPASTVQGRQQLAEQYGLQGVEAQTYVLTGKLPDGVKPVAPPAGYQWNADGTQAFIPGGPADPATAGKTTEATRRNQQLAKVIVPEMDTLAKNWQALSDVGNQAAGSSDLTAGLSSPQYQQAKNSLKTIIASYLYSVSGATANPGEVENQAAILTPKFGESPESVADKLKRVQTMVQAVVDAAQGTPIDVGNGAAPAGGVDDILAKYGL